MSIRPFRIISGGQTGADRAALDWAIARRVRHGGWCPLGRKAEDGPIPQRYRLKETPSADYLVRTRWNVRDSYGTVIFSISERLSGGTRRTAEMAVALKKPLLHLSAREHATDGAQRLGDFVRHYAIRVLNVAGPRASKEPGVGHFVFEILDQCRLLPAEAGQVATPEIGQAKEI